MKISEAPESGSPSSGLPSSDRQSREAEFAEDLKSSRHFEASLVWRESLAIALVVALIVMRQLWFI